MGSIIVQVQEQALAEFRETLDAALDAGAAILERAPEWDGHTSWDVLERLLCWAWAQPAGAIIDVAARVRQARRLEASSD